MGQFRHLRCPLEISALPPIATASPLPQPWSGTKGPQSAKAVGDRGGCRIGRRWKLCLAVQSAFSQRAAASALSSGRVLNAIAASGAALCTALITASNIDRLWGGRRMPAPITTQS